MNEDSLVSTTTGKLKTIHSSSHNSSKFIVFGLRDSVYVNGFQV